MKTKKKYIQPISEFTPLQSPCSLMAGSNLPVSDEEAVLGQQAKQNPLDLDPDLDSDSDEQETDSLYQFNYTWD